MTKEKQQQDNGGNENNFLADWGVPAEAAATHDDGPDFSGGGDDPDEDPDENQQHQQQNDNHQEEEEEEDETLDENDLDEDLDEEDDTTKGADSKKNKGAEKSKATKKKDASGDDPEDIDDDELDTLTLGKEITVDGDPEIAEKLKNVDAGVVAKKLGIKFKKGEEVTMDAITKKVENIIKLATTDTDPDINMLRQFKLDNANATIFDFAKEQVSPFKAFLELDNKTLIIEKLKRVDKKSPAEALAQVEEMEEAGTIDATGKTIRDELTEADKEHETNRKAKHDQLVAGRKAKAIEKQKKLLTVFKENRDKMFDGHFKVSNSEIVESFNYIKSGQVYKDLEDEKVLAEFAVFQRNRKAIMSTIKGSASRNSKAMILGKLSNAKQTIPDRAESQSDGFNKNDW
jgi:hypothetical protein